MLVLSPSILYASSRSLMYPNLGMPCFLPFDVPEAGHRGYWCARNRPPSPLFSNRGTEELFRLMGTVVLISDISPQAIPSALYHGLDPLTLNCLSVWFSCDLLPRRCAIPSSSKRGRTPAGKEPRSLSGGSPHGAPIRYSLSLVSQLRIQMKERCPL
jgi:hypothetical protein